LQALAATAVRHSRHAEFDLGAARTEPDHGPARDKLAILTPFLSVTATDSMTELLESQGICQRDQDVPSGFVRGCADAFWHHDQVLSKVSIDPSRSSVFARQPMERQSHRNGNAGLGDAAGGSGPLWPVTAG
jgi:hypothetical protein